jgi:hypothetical protein
MKPLPICMALVLSAVFAAPSDGAPAKTTKPLPAPSAAQTAEPYAPQDKPEPPIGPASARHTVKDYAALGALPDWAGLWVFNFGPPSAPPQLTPAFAADVKARAEAQAKGADSARPSNCLAPGMPLIMSQPYNVEFLFTPGRVTVIQEAYMQVRRIFTDGRGHPADLEASFNGHSIGHWEGQTLVVDTVGFKPRTMLNPTTPHSDQMHIIERIHLKDPQTLVDEMTIDDPLALARPWTTTLTYTRHREWDQIEFICDENNRNPVDETGKTRFILRDNPDAK